MHRITLLSVGKIKTPWILEGCDAYRTRIRRSADFREKVLSPGTAAEEQERILASLEKEAGMIVVLDERGTSMSSREFAVKIGHERDRGTPLCFVVGGAYGLDERVRKRASLVLALGPMTLPHELAQLLFLEQLYRACEILKGSGYHH